MSYSFKLKLWGISGYPIFFTGEISMMKQYRGDSRVTRSIYEDKDDVKCIE